MNRTSKRTEPVRRRIDDDGRAPGLLATLGLCLLLLLTLGSPPGAEAQQQVPPPPGTEEPDPREGITFSILPDVTWTNWDGDTGIENTTLLGATLSLGFGRFVDLQGYYRREGGAVLETVGVDDDVFDQEIDIASYGAQIVFSFLDGDVVPILLGGGGIYDFSPDNGEDLRRLKVNYGGGVRATLADWIHGELTVEGQSFRLDAGDIGEIPGVDPDGNGDTRTNLSLRAGLGFMLGGVGAAPPARQVDPQVSENRLTDLAFAVEPFAGIIDFAGGTGLGSQDLIGARLGANIGPYLGVRGFYWHGVDFFDSFDDVRGWGGEAQFNLAEAPGFVPFLVVGGGRIDFQDDFEAPEGVTSPSDQNALIVGGGLDFNLGERIQLAAAVRDYITSGDDFANGNGFDDVESPDDLLHNWQYTASLNFLVGGGGGFRPAVARPDLPEMDPDMEEMEWRQREIEQRQLEQEDLVTEEDVEDPQVREQEVRDQELREEMREELRVTLREDLREDLRADLLEELREELRGEFGEELRDEMREDFHEEVREDLHEQLREELREELLQELSDQLREELREDLRETLREDLRRDLREQLRDDRRDDFRDDDFEEFRDDEEEFRQEEDIRTQDRQQMERMIEEAVDRRIEQAIPEETLTRQEVDELEQRLRGEIEELEARMNSAAEDIELLQEEIQQLRDEIEELRQEGIRQQEEMEMRLREEQQVREEQEGVRDRIEDAIEPRPEDDRDPVIENDVDIQETVQEAVPDRIDLSQIRPYAGVGVNDNTQVVFGLGANLGPVSEGSNWNIVPEIALGIGEGPTTFMAVANLEYQVPWIFQQENFRFDPLLGVGAGLLNEDDLEAVLNLFYGGVLHLGGQPGDGLSLFLAHQGVDIFSDNRFLAGLSFGRVGGQPAPTGTQ